MLNRAMLVSASLTTALLGGTLLASATIGAQPAAPLPQSAWTISAPDASLAWFALLDQLNLDGAGAFPFVAHATTHRVPTGQTAPERSVNISALAAALHGSRHFEVLHFAPLYYPSASRAALAAALRSAAATPVRAPHPRAALVIAALTNALPADARLTHLPRLAEALEQVQPDAPPSVTQLKRWQRMLDSVFVPALAPWLHTEKLNAGTLIISPSIGAEGRLFAGTADRADNLVAVGAFDGDATANAPLMAFVREICFPAVSRAMTASRSVNTSDPQNARRASLSAVRCGADLLDRFLPTQANAYRAFWLRQASSTATAEQFNTVFPTDPALQPMLATAMQRARAVK